MIETNCRNCRFFNDDADLWQFGAKLGVCRRYPPTWIKRDIPDNSDGDDDSNSDFPTVYLDDWCGEWQENLTLRTQSTETA